MEVLKKKKSNRGNAVIEITLLVPVLFGVIYLYIMFFLYLIQMGAAMEECGLQLYENERNKEVKGTCIHAKVENTDGLFEVTVEFIGNNSDPVEHIRRWQFAVDTIS